MNKSLELEQLESQIRDRYDNLSKRLKQVAKYILDNSNSIVFDTVAVIAERADVPPSTLIRFANAFGYSGFNEMKQIFRENLMEETVNYSERAVLFDKIDPDNATQGAPNEILNVFAQANNQALLQLVNQISPEQLESAVELLHSANNIFIIGLKRSFSVASYLNYALHHLDCHSYIIDGLGGMFEEQLNLIKPGDVVVAISFSPYAKETINIMNAVAKSGVKQIAITDSQISPLVGFSDVAFVVKEAQVSGFRSQCATMTLVQTLAISLAFKRKE
ncbi:MurR/RpiR family transcriptional regulator [Testudinibacter sp. TR-2022]|uniref:MurR/RpiR family transcriptional regulator n=1 Tax=Testudinibacter sp. TR-2022 TaxID=2585029 RepID=UPI001117D911|nr:MurR/RpiR family transcriptional regulator [Testudinibacter sp. TR-2022]TNH06873.1 MurR/RpiR family transcriptional regulator [Pasteurellaceae bacterium Phil11]TNH21716.1 MurR/RpiR family transcriptional regulator [Testudinibacter sp. TR-2022]TNH28888.1 MurR/RpiR family transcriptional regulator [Testudinibacter sp. TR-2022]